LRDPREIAVVQEVARLSKWQSRPSPTATRSGAVLRGRGVSLNSGFGGYVATVAEVEVERATGRVWPRRFFVVQGVSRTLFEEVRFDERGVLSVDWATYPILEVGDAPESIEIATINRPEEPSGGAGEPAHVT